MEPTTSSSLPPSHQSPEDEIRSDVWPHRTLAPWETRLVDALQAFNVSTLPKYDLRPSARDKNKLGPSTHVDQDESGDFDPNQKDLSLPAPLKRKREPGLSVADAAGNTPKRRKASNWRQGRYEGASFVVVLKFASDIAKAIFATSATEAAAEFPEVGLSDDCSEEKIWRYSDYDTAVQGAAPHSLRRRAKEESEAFEYPALGYPAARGCKACFDLGQTCWLLDEGSSYPCTLCREDDHDCDLIISPLRKRSCEGCKRKKAFCSYREEDSNHSLPCDLCTKRKIKCIAGPQSGRTRVGPSMDQYPSERVKAANALERSLLSRDEDGRLSKGAENGRTKRKISLKMFPFIDLGPRNGGSTGVTAPKVFTYTSLIPVKEPSTKVKTKIITTQYAHPITFNYQPQTSCHWCVSPAYGLLGLGETKVEVLDHADGNGFVEIGGGHVSRGAESSKMCQGCTLERLMIAACRVHELESLEDAGIKDAGAMDTDFGAVMEYMMPDAPPAPFEWCSICPSPAYYACCKKPDLDLGLDLGGTKGCGLLLCENCTASLLSEHSGCLDALIDNLKSDGSGGAFGLRADAEFLLPSGELLRRVGR